jgi:hypothetical protein
MWQPCLEGCNCFIRSLLTIGPDHLTWPDSMKKVGRPKGISLWPLNCSLIIKILNTPWGRPDPGRPIGRPEAGRPQGVSLWPHNNLLITIHLASPWSCNYPINLTWLTVENDLSCYLSLLFCLKWIVWRIWNVCFPRHLVYLNVDVQLIVAKRFSDYIVL